MPSKSFWPQNGYRVTLLFLLCFKFAGLATISLKNRRTLKKKCSENLVFFTGSKLGVFYNLFLSCLIIASNFIFLPSINNTEYAFMTNVTRIIENSQEVLGTLAIFSILLYYCINESTFVKIGNYLIHLMGALCRLQQPLNWKHIFYVLFFVYLLNFSLFVSVLVIDVISFNSPVTSLGSILPASFMNFCFIQYFSVLSLTDAISININCAIQDLCRSKFGDITPNTLYETRHVFVSYSKIHLVVRIRHVHDQLCDITNEISRFYSLPTLIGLSLTSYILLYNVYYLFQPIMVQNAGVVYMTVADSLVWIIFLLYPIGLLTSKATKVTNEIGRTGNLVHALLNCTIDRQTKVELEQFSLQLLHRKIKFTVNEYFTLDNTLFQSILSTVTTYMVILIQLQAGTSVPNAYPSNCTQ